MGELRGERLITMLQGNFDNLEELMTRDHMTARDPIVTYAVNPTKLSYLSVLDDVMTAQERAVVHRHVGDVVVANTTLRDLWKLPENTDSTDGAPKQLGAAPADGTRSAQISPDAGVALQPPPPRFVFPDQYG